MANKKLAKFEGQILPITKAIPFYMVLVEDSLNAPKKKHESYEDAFLEMLRLSKQENKKAYVLVSVTKVEQTPNITQFNT